MFNPRQAVNRRILPVFASAILVTLFALIPTIVTATDWPCFRGANHDGVSPDQITVWPTQRLWSANIGIGFSWVSVCQGKVYAIGDNSSLNQETVSCFDELTTSANPTPLWTYSFSVNDYFPGNNTFTGVRATPTVDGNAVYTFSIDGQLKCIDAQAGTLLWNCNVPGDGNNWGYAGSPLIEGNMVIVNAFGQGVGIDKTTHSVAWGTSAGGSCGYASPFEVTLGSQRTVVIWGGQGIYGVNPINGNVLWNYAWKMYNTADPIVSNNMMFASSWNYDGSGCSELVNLGSDSGTITSYASKSAALSAYVSPIVLYNGAVYGVCGSDSPALACLGFSDCSPKWRQNDGIDYRSSVSVAGDKLVLMNGADYSVRIIQANTSAYTELFRTNLLSVNGDSGQFINSTIANGRMYVRTHAGALAVYQVGVLGGGINTTGSFQFASSTYSVPDNGGSVTIQVARVNGSSGTVSVAYSTANGTATAGSDYVAASGTLTFNPGETSKTFTVSIIDGMIAAPDKTVNLIISNPTGGATLGNPTNAVLTILNVHRPPITTLYWDPAGSKTGTGSGGNGTWDTTASAWYQGSGSSDQTWADNKDACFYGNAGTVTLSTPVTPGSITFGQSNYVITASTITLTNSGIIAAVNMLTNDLVEIDSVVAGSVGLVKNGPGVLTLGNAANTYTGPTVINLGSLYLGANGKIPNSTSLTVNPSAFMILESSAGNVSGRLSATAPATLNSGWMRITSALSGSPNDQIGALNIGAGHSVLYFHYELSGVAFSLDHFASSQGGALQVSGDIQNGVAINVANANGFIGSGTAINPCIVWCKDVNRYIYSDFMYLNNQRLHPLGLDGLYSGSISSGSITANNIKTGSAQAINAATTINSLILDGSSDNPGSTADITGTGALTISSGALMYLRSPPNFNNQVVFPNGVEGHVYIGNDSAVESGAMPFTCTINASFSGNCGLTITGQPKYPYSGSPLQSTPHPSVFNPNPAVLAGASTYTGPTTINAQTVQISAPANFGNSTNIILNFGGALSPSGNNFMNSNQTLTLNPGSVLSAAGYSSTLGNLIFNPGYLSVAATNATLTVSGIVAGQDNGQPRAGILPMTGNLTINGGYQIDIGGLNPGNGPGYYSQLQINGNVAVGASAALSVVLSAAPSPGAQYTVISNLSASAISGTFSGAPEGGTVQALYAGTNYSFTVSYVGGDGNDMTLTAVSGPVIPVITSPTSANGMVGQAFSYQITASGSPTNYNATGLPSGLSVNRATGLISGTPSTPCTNSVPLSAINSNGTGTATLTITISALVPPTITSATTATGTVGLAFSYQITATGSPTNYNATGLPAGLNLNASSGLISGTPTTPCTNSVTLTAYGLGGTGSTTLTITIALPPAPVITSATTANGMVGQPFTYQITASGNPTNFNATGLPSGLNINRTSGMIAGTPTTPITNSVTLSASGVGGTGNATLTITVTPVPPGPTGLIGWWKLDESSGTTALDSSGNGNNGTLNGGTWQPAGGHFAGAIQLALGNTVNCGSTTSLNTPSVTVAFWMKADGLETASPIDKLPQTGSVGYAVKLRGDGSIWFRVGAEGGSALDVYGATGIYAAGTWVHVACTFDAATGNMRMYINDVVEAHQPSYAVTLNAASTAFLMSSTREPYAGLLDDVRVYDHALTVSEIAAVMAGTGGVQPPVISGMTPAAGKPQLSWVSANGTTYAVYRSTNLLASWPTQAMTNISGDGSLKTFIDATTIQREAFYRITAR